MMILVLNSGSSSLKFKIYDMPRKRVLLSGSIESIGSSDSRMTLQTENGNAIHEDRVVATHTKAFSMLEDIVSDAGIEGGLESIYAAGHRVVHGGKEFSESVLVSGNVLKRLEKLSHLAPLHNPANIMGIRELMRISPSMRQIAVFDTAFHHTLPPEAFMYAVAEDIFHEKQIRRYGFHGLSHAYVTKQLSMRSGISPDRLNIISVHLGNGSSICAVKNGKSIDTSMGFTPMEGLVMGSRSGDIDPGVLIYLMRNYGYDAERLDDLLNKRSGLSGLCGDSDMRAILSRMKDGDTAAALAYDIFTRRIVKYIGAYAVLLGRVDAIAFTGGIGENSCMVRESICDGLLLLGISADRELNEKADMGGGAFHSVGSSAELWVIPADEESVIADETFSLAGRIYRSP